MPLPAAKVESFERTPNYINEASSTPYVDLEGDDHSETVESDWEPDPFTAQELDSMEQFFNFKPYLHVIESRYSS